MYAVLEMAEETTLAANVRALREASGLTQKELAAASGVGVTNIRQIEQGDVNDPRLSTLRAIAHALGVKPEALYEGVPRNPPQTRRGAKKKPRGDGDSSN